MICKCPFSAFIVSGLESTSWNLDWKWTDIQEQLGVFEFELNSKKAAPIPPLSIAWEVPLLDTVNCWTTGHKGAPDLPPDWGSDRNFSIADEIPELLFHNRAGNCTAAAAFSDAMRSVCFRGGVFEGSCSLRFELKLFRKQEAPCQNYHAAIRLDLRGCFFADTARDFSEWYASFPEYTALSVPPSALEPLYSTWYSYHHDVNANAILKECREAVKYGMKTVIVDSGWETDDNALGTVACGDWEVCSTRFPDFAAHVREVQKLGMRYMLWFAVPFIGKNSKAYSQFRDRFLFEQELAGVLDPRFPSVRQYLIECCSRLMRDYGVDGLKLDFINTFTECEHDPVLNSGMGERDLRTIPEGIDRLMMDIAAELRRIRPDALIEFRQCYIGPAIRKYGNMFRAADCPADHAGNRRRTINLRLTSGATAVHSDMLEWRTDYNVAHAALQLWNVMFSVPQISVRLAELPAEHRKMLNFLLTFQIRHRTLLLKSALHPMHPEENYPAVFATDGRERILTIYSEEAVASFADGFDGVSYLVNATAADSLVIELAVVPEQVLLRSCTGEVLKTDVLHRGLFRLPMPSGSILKFS